MAIFLIIDFVFYIYRLWKRPTRHWECWTQPTSSNDVNLHRLDMETSFFSNFSKIIYRFILKHFPWNKKGWSRTKKTANKDQICTGFEDNLRQWEKMSLRAKMSVRCDKYTLILEICDEVCPRIRKKYRYWSPLKIRFLIEPNFEENLWAGLKSLGVGKLRILEPNYGL